MGDSWVRCRNSSKHSFKATPHSACDFSCHYQSQCRILLAAATPFYLRAVFTRSPKKSVFTLGTILWYFYGCRFRGLDSTRPDQSLRVDLARAKT